MKGILKRKLVVRLIFGSLVAFIGIQFIPVDRSNPPVESEISVSPELRVVLQKACYDCHSHQTVWPWYSFIAPISWLVASDVHEGRDELNFSAWNRYDSKQQAKKFKEIWEEVEEGEMPPSNYLLMHKEAALSPAERELIHKWIVTSVAK